MAKKIVLEAINYFEKQLEQTGLHVSKVILFGSQAKGEATEDSDVDIVVLSDDFRDKDIFERVRLTMDAEVLTIKKFMIPFDIITMTPEEFESGSSLIGLYASEGEVVYG
jgi:predicted nucleotidyltransferase